jgi:ATP-dependent exoDNAse (exonuclease V) beta subunit
MACDQGILPLDERVADAADEAELDDIYETERRLLYVACTRAREQLLLSGVTPTSLNIWQISPHRVAQSSCLVPPRADSR